ncbi:MAG: DUF58 domain-containing protein [Deltaproteobacteria bacterium]|nr:DUF58 domain-containing protein [Deltaproteobacteria bacterium]
MHTNPRPSTIATAMAGVGLALIAILANRPEAALAGGALLVAVAWGRAATRGDVARARRAGFEMVWREPSRRARLGVGSSRVFVAELRNRSDRVVHVTGLRAVASEGVRVVVRPNELDVMPGGFARIEVEVTGRRVGRHGVHGLALGAGGVGASFEVPLTFANVLGVEVVPRAIDSGLRPPRGGRLRADPAAGRARSRRGEGTEIREIRDIAPGDSFRKIAWKASARRGKLMVREMDIEERDVIWIVVDVSAEGWAGPVGEAPLDRAIDVAANFAVERARHGAAVGVACTTDHVVVLSPPQKGGADLDRLGAVWLDAADHYGADRCGLTADELLRLDVEHARPLDPLGLGDLPRGDVDRLLQRLEALRARAPFQLPPPLAASTNEGRDRIVRHYAASFALDVPGRATGAMSTSGVADALRKIHRLRPRPTDVVVVAAAPTQVSAELREAATMLRKKGVRVRWAAVDPRLGLDAPPGGEPVRDAVEIEIGVARKKALSLLAGAGVRVLDAWSLVIKHPQRRLPEEEQPGA